MTDYDKLCEKYMIKRVRSFYPRKFDLSPEFIEAFKAEYSRLIEKKTGFKNNIDFHVCYSPERINPGDKKNSLTKINKIV